MEEFMYIFNLCFFASYFSKIKKAEWATLPLKDSLGVLFLDLGIDNIVSESFCAINIKRIDKEIIRSGREYKLLKMIDNENVSSLEFVAKSGVIYKFISAHFDGYHIRVSFEVGDEKERIIKETLSVWELRRFMDVDIPKPLQVLRKNMTSSIEEKINI